MKLRTKIAAVAAAAVGVTALTGIAVAGIPSTTNTVTACVNTAGAPRIIDTDAGQTCTTGEKQVTWSAGWRHRGTFTHQTRYQVGDVVLLPSPGCSTGGIAYVDEPSTWIKTGSDSGICPLDGGWVALTPLTRPHQVPGPVGFRLGASDSGTSHWDHKYTVKTWNYGDVAWINVTHANVADCTVSVTPVADVPLIVTRGVTSYPDWILLRIRKPNGEVLRAPLDVLLDCPLRAR